jgi:hypothetical protein
MLEERERWRLKRWREGFTLVDLEALNYALEIAQTGVHAWPAFVHDMRDEIRTEIALRVQRRSLNDEA